MKNKLILTTVFFSGLAIAQQHPLFKDADLKAGEKLIAENKCNECHIRRVGGVNPLSDVCWMIYISGC